MSDSLWPHGLQHTRLPCLSPIPRAYSNSYPAGDTVKPSHTLSSSSPPAFNLSQHQGLFQCVSSLHQVAEVLEFQLSFSPSNENPGLLFFGNYWFDLLGVQGIQESSPTPQFKSIGSSVFSFLYSPTLISTRDYWKKQVWLDWPLSANNVSAF